MTDHTLIDGNNLLHAMHAHAPVPNVGRETLVRVVERWAHRVDAKITLVFDGAGPQGPFAKQMASRRIDVVFAAPRIADDVIVDMVKRSREPLTISVVTDDNAVAYEARRRRAIHVGCRAFIDMLFSANQEKSQSPSTQGPPAPESPDAPEKPPAVSKEESDAWVEQFEQGLDLPDDPTM